MKTIKQRISYAVMGLMAMGFTACTQNEDMAPTLKGQEINATFSVGGMATWNGKNSKGQRASSGVYLVFCSASQGEKTAVTKILFIR